MRIDGLTPTDSAATATAATAVDPKLHEAESQFEELLVRELTQVMAESAKAAQDEESGAAAGFYADQLPNTLASAIKASMRSIQPTRCTKAMVNR